MNYYAFISGLPELSFDEQKKVLSTHEFKDELFKILSWKDKKIVRKLFLKYDNDNLFSYLKNGEEIIAFNEQANYSPDVIMEMVENVKNEDDKWNNKYPEYLHFFIHDYLFFEKDPKEFWEDHLSTHYYNYLLKKTSNRFLKQWSELNMNVRNILTALSARRASVEYDYLIVGSSEVATILRASQHPAGVTEFIDYYEQLREIDEIQDLLDKEQEIDTLLWKWIEDYTFFNYFDVEKIMAYLFKLQIIERWKKLDPEKGNEIFRNMVNNLKSSAKLITKK
jgi:hypothetical protein